mmetsp:Transcript_4602/g.18403  ORF Transcript_4602/g.18403 Transcript_4602/m.18403 type:complete len:202 (+) Transcript_4602:1083-1688(+)
MLSTTRMSPASEGANPLNTGVSPSVWYQHVSACTSEPGRVFLSLRLTKLEGTSAGTPADHPPTRPRLSFRLDSDSVARGLRKNRHRFSGGVRHHRSHAVARYRTYAPPCTASAASMSPCGRYSSSTNTRSPRTNRLASTRVRGTGTVTSWALGYPSGARPPASSPRPRKMACLRAYGSLKSSEGIPASAPTPPSPRSASCT